ncbi:MAG: HEAT repeat domain-containing protein [Planctomycetota bacterium]
MRTALGFLLLVSLCRADEAQDVRGLVERLGAPTYEERQAAYARLSAYGDRIFPLLKDITAFDPHIRRQLRALTRAARKLSLILGATTEPLPIGSPVVLKVRLINDTEDTYHLPATRGSPRGVGTLSSFWVLVSAQKRRDGAARLLKPDEVDWETGMGRVAIVRPGEVMRVTIRLDGEHTPLLRPGAVNISVGFENNTAQRWASPQPGDQRDADAVRVALKAPAIVVTAYGRKPAELEKALNTPKRRASAVAELSVRDDAAVLPLLRRHAKDRDLRLAAIRRLGANGDEQDFDLIHDSTKSPDADVRRAAVLALGNYVGQKASRRRLVALAQDHELAGPAIRALAKHKHPVTVELFIRILRRGYADRAVEKAIRDAIYDWTGMHVSHKRSEVRAFERWWARNRERWIRDNVSGK